jgi:hypothetical protein
MSPDPFLLTPSYYRLSPQANHALQSTAGAFGRYSSTSRLLSPWTAAELGVIDQ